MTRPLPRTSRRGLFALLAGRKPPEFSLGDFYAKRARGGEATKDALPEFPLREGLVGEGPIETVRAGAPDLRNSSAPSPILQQSGGKRGS